MSSVTSFNPRAPHGARLALGAPSVQDPGVSIHAPRTGRDERAQAQLLRRRVSIHAPRTGRDQGHMGRIAMCGVSIHAPRTGRDFRRARALRSLVCFNPRAPHGARLPPPIRVRPRLAVSIHAPRTGRDQARPRQRRVRGVSIHAPRTGRDHQQIVRKLAILRFQSTRPARGATCQSLVGATRALQFQSTRPARGAT